VSAPAGNVLPKGTLEFEFKGIRLHGYATEIIDDIQWRIASHEFDRRDGGQAEPMGRAPAQHRVTLVFVDAPAFDDATAFLTALEIDPSGLLIHPIYGKKQATCSGTQGARLTVQEVNVYVVPVTFIENNLDGSVVGEQSQGAAAKAQAVSDQADAVDGLADPYSTVLDEL
jgi:prophage DNA circulation protein